MAIPFNPPPPDEYALRRLHELVEELYVLIVCHLMSNEQAVKPPEPQKRRGASCTDDERNATLNIKRDGGDSDSDPDSCAAATTATSANSLFAEVAAELDLVRQDCRRHRTVLTYMRKLTEHQPRPSFSGTPVSSTPTSETSPTPCSCSCRGGLPSSSKNIGSSMTPGPHSPRRNGQMNQERSSFGSILSIFRRNLLSTTLSAIIACFVGYRLFYSSNFLNFLYPR